MKVASLLNLVAAAATLVSAGEFIPNTSSDFIPGAFIIEFLDDFDYKQSGISLSLDINLSFDIRHKYSIFNGMSIRVKSDHTGDDLAAMEGVKRVWPVQLVHVPKPQPSKENLAQPFLTNSHRMTGVNYIRETFGNTGKGIKVGIIDSGVDYKHPAFGDCPGNPGPGCRVAFGWDFVGDDFDKTGTAVEDDDPMDECNGHGTHVAGIVGADARNIGAPQPFVGVAPEVTLGAYRVLSCDGFGPNDGIIKAMEKAANDTMDIINMSLGSGSDYRSGPLAVVADKLNGRGVAVVASAGNSGDDGVWSVSNGGLGAFTTSVASFDNIAAEFYYFTYDGVKYPYLPSDTWGKPLNLPPSATLVPILKKNGFLAEGCTADSYAGFDVKDKVALVLLGTACGSGMRGDVAKAAGAVGVLMRSSPPGIILAGGIAGFPMATVEPRAGPLLRAASKKNPAAPIQWSTTKETFVTQNSGKPSAFSSWGFDGDLHIKPDISGPGGEMLSIYPQKMGSYYMLSGTSMSSPYVAGAFALLFNMTGGALPGQDARRRFINTAIPGSFSNRTKPAPVAKQGSGLINVKDALTTTTYFSTNRFPTTDRIELLDSVRFAGKINVQITNVGKNETVYTLSHEPAQSVISYRGGNTSPFTTPLLENDEATVTFSNTSVTVPAGKSVTISLQFQEPSTGLASEFPFYSGYIVATPRDAVPVRLPYAGIKGDVSQVPMLDTKAGFPNFVIYNKNNQQTRNVTAGYKINWDVDEPQIRTRLGSHTPELSIRLYKAETFIGYLDTPSGIAANKLGRDRNVSPDGQLVFRTTTWRNGMIYTDRNAKTATAAKPGTYRVVVAAQRKFSKGDAYPADFEVREVATITL
ncbi:MAG: peptidase S8/S53 domain-containing protein [Benniella sp.]|nr:MAG: peptidase S8/S53 domain-containing protein [Benniella sp.]